MNGPFIWPRPHLISLPTLELIFITIEMTTEVHTLSSSLCVVDMHWNFKLCQRGVVDFVECRVVN